MSLLELFAIAVGLSMDAFAVSVCKGLSLRRYGPGRSLTAGIYFGGFQALMPLIGWALGVRFQQAIANVDHWIAFGLLTLIGINMLREARQEGDSLDEAMGPAAMLPLAVATSIDALAVGVTFAFLQVSILPAVSFIGVTTFVLSALGVWAGSAFGARWRERAEQAGGIILILMGVKILAEHVGLL
ncbi:MAG: manganese efflux pump [Oscillospiraceae bacterium]|nr:manganese efflux pump [Oscillospiraceae bacterium]